MENSFKASQSFILRDGWVQKALIEMRNNPGVNVFSKKDGVIYLGVGSNMVTSIKYWLEAAGIIEPGAKKIPVLTEFGRLIDKWDRYLETALVWDLIHVNLASNYKIAPLFWILFNVLGTSESFTKETFIEDAMICLRDSNKEEPNRQYIEDDFAVLVRSYLPSEKKDPEDNMDCPLSGLGLLKQTSRGQFRKTQASTENLEDLVVYYVSRALIGKKESIPFDDLVAFKEGPCKLFNLDRASLMAVFMRLDNRGIVKVVRTAGLNTIYFNRKDYSLENLFDDVMGGNKQ